jgi:endoglucanase
MRLGRISVVALAGALVVAGCSGGGDGDDDDSATPDEPAVEQVLYRDPDTQAAAWAEDHADDDRAQVIRDEIAAVPQARWFVDADPATIADEVTEYVEPAAAAGEVPALVPYAIFGRDCGGASSGGAPSLDAWLDWIDALASALGDGMGDGRAIVVLEPDALAQEDCLSADEAAARHEAMARAVAAFREAAPGAEVYLDAGHSDWNEPAEQARRLQESGVLDAAGFATNVSNFNTTDDEVAYGEALLDELAGDGGGAGARDELALRQVIDVSRNEQGPAPDGEWCDPPGRGLGTAPTLDTGIPTVAALLWVKSPGEADGCAAAPGVFMPDHALALLAAAP